ncbi:MAG: hypothetical protein ABUL60_36480 [Myxococcales bacterium]
MVHATGVALEPLVARLCAELTLAGYATSFNLSDPPVACERGATAWINLAPSSTDRAAVVATLCVDGTEVTIAGPRADPARLAISTAEALNGLGATAPPSTPRLASAVATPARESPRHAVSAAQTLLVDPAGFPLLWGTSVDVELGLTEHAAVALAGFFPIARAKLSTSSAELRTGVAWLRVGVALRYSLARFAVAGSLVVGPAYTWVTARAVAPYVSGADFAFGVAGSAGLSVSYPHRGPVFAVAGSRAVVLLPGPRFELPNEEPRDLGPLLIEASLGIGLRL